ncbi:MAG: hypothetical protein HGB31_02560 [Erysipelotrichaceae bacterium]|nr:hypothetical protein [Erysipelotrichaceae bacterium]
MNIINPIEDEINRGVLNCQGNVTCSEKLLLWVFVEISNLIWPKARIDIRLVKSFCLFINETENPSKDEFVIVIYALIEKAYNDSETLMKEVKFKGISSYKGTHELVKVNLVYSD